MMVLDDSQVCRECAAYGAGNGTCANLPAHPFDPETIEEYVTLHPDDRAAAEYLRTRNEEARLSAEWKQVLGRHEGHMANLLVTRNETGLPWVDGWTKGDETLEALMSAAMTELDRNRPPPSAASNASNFDPFSE